MGTFGHRVGWVVLAAFWCLSTFGQMVDVNPDAATPLFDSPEVEEIRLTLDPANWNTLRERFLEDDYYPANLTWRDITVANVGIRSRGNGSRNQLKPALKVSIDKYQKQKFLGLETLVLLNLVQDHPMLREYLSMQAFRRMGLPAPRQNFVKLFINDEYWGLYLAVEAVDKNFLKRTLDDDKGWLYDYEWAAPYRWEYLGAETTLYSDLPFQVETNKSKPNVEALVDMIHRLDQTSPETFVDDMNSTLNLEAFALYLATEVYLAEMDGLVGDLGTNNFYLYQGEKDQRFRFIPWDKSAAMMYYTYPIWRNIPESVLGRKGTGADPMKTAFLTSLGFAAADLGGAGGWLHQLTLASVNRIRDAAMADEKKPWSNAEFEQACMDVLFFVTERNPDVLRQLQEELPQAAPVEDPVP